jgi:hypothetical protein
VAACVGLVRTKSLTGLQGKGMWFGILSLLSGMAFLGFMSLIFDFHDSAYPSRDYPFFASGRLIFGAAIPFFLVLVLGLDRVVDRLGIPRLKPLILSILILSMLVCEAVNLTPVFASQYNLFHIHV